MPIPGTGVFHPLWNEHHRPTTTTTLTGECTVTRQPGDEGTVDDNGDYTPPAPTTVYTGPCRMWLGSTTNEQLMLRGDNTETHRRYQVALRYDADVQVDDIITVTTAKDTALVGRRLRIISVLPTTEQWQRDLFADDLEA